MSSEPVPAAAVPPAPEPLLAAPAAAPRPARRRGVAWPLLGLIGFLLLAAGELYLWRLERMRPDDAGVIAAFQAQLQAVQGQLAALPPPAPATPAPASPAAASPQLAGQLAALQAQFAADHAALAAVQANAVDTGRLSADIGAVQTETNVDHAALLGLQTQLAGLNKLTARVLALGRLDAAAMALAAGQPLGAIANAPPALAKFADTAPPTEAALRLAYPDAARAADNASVSGRKKGYWAVVKARLENLVTISNGSHVIVGAPAAGLVAQAGVRLDAGDLPGAVALLGTLSADEQQAMGGWLGQARDLLAARAALTTLAAGQN